MFTPARNANGTFEFTYTLASEFGVSNKGVVTVEVNAVNDRPSANDLRVTNVVGSRSIFLSGSDIETIPGNLSYEIVTSPSIGSIQRSGRVVTYTPPAGGLQSSTSFRYRVRDNGDPAGSGSNRRTSASATVTILPPIAAGVPTIPGGFHLGGKAIQNYVAGATIFLDANRNGELDFLDSNANGIQDVGEPMEPSAITEQDGSYSYSLTQRSTLTATAGLRSATAY